MSSEMCRRPRALQNASLAVVTALIISLCGCDRASPDGSARIPTLRAVSETFDDGSPRQRPEFEAMAQTALNEGNPGFFMRPQLAMLNRMLDDDSLTTLRRIEITAQLAQALLKEGETDKAVEALNDIDEMGKAESDRLERNFELQYLRGMVYLRQAEVQNCILRHNADCCVFPLKDGGVHTQREPAEKARAAFLKCAELRPGDLSARWMVNLLAMALGEYPDSVPTDLLVPPEAFESDFDIKRFPDVAAKVGLNTMNYAGGALAEDFDGDGLLDMVTSSLWVEQPMTYKHNDGNGTFSDRSTDSRLDDQLGGLNCVAADFDNDGDMDILVLRGAWLFDDGRMRVSLLRNDGRGVFADVTRAAGIAEPPGPTQVGVWADFDNDGDLDLFIGHESRLGMGDPKGDYPSQLFRNNGDGTFTDVASSAGVLCKSYVKGASAGDYDNDGLMDLYVSNVGPNMLYHNDGQMKFTEVAAAAGVVEPKGRSFATWFFDYDNDGWLDIYVGGYEALTADVCANYLGMPDKGVRSCVYHNNRNGTFTNVATEMGLDRPILPMGANVGDLDNDGWLDMYLTTGNPDLDMLVPNLMFRNDGGTKFQDVTKSGGFGHLQKGHGVAFADFDNDGDQDVFHQIGGFFRTDAFRNALYQNPGHGNHFLTLVVQGAKSNRNGVGARIKLTLDTPNGPRELHRAVGSVSSFGGSPLSRLSIGLGDATAIKSLEITWPVTWNRGRQFFENVPMDAAIRVTEGQSEFERVNLPVITF